MYIGAVIFLLLVGSVAFAWWLLKHPFTPIMPDRPAPCDADGDFSKITRDYKKILADHLEKMEGIPSKAQLIASCENYRQLQLLWEKEAEESSDPRRKAQAEKLAYHAEMFYHGTVAFYQQWEV